MHVHVHVHVYGLWNFMLLDTDDRLPLRAKEIYAQAHNTSKIWGMKIMNWTILQNAYNTRYFCMHFLGRLD